MKIILQNRRENFWHLRVTAEGANESKSGSYLKKNYVFIIQMIYKTPHSLYRATTNSLKGS